MLYNIYYIFKLKQDVFMSNKKIRIGIDVDNVVLDFTGRFIECFYTKQK